MPEDGVDNHLVVVTIFFVGDWTGRPGTHANTANTAKFLGVLLAVLAETAEFGGLWPLRRLYTTLL